jgi:malate dehydrogenase (oxaloacetate-decarboxylating)
MTNATQIRTQLTGANLLSNPLLNKGTAFTDEERVQFKLLGLLPPHIDKLEDQVVRAYEAFSAKTSDIEKHIYLRALQDDNEVLFYKLLLGHIEEMMPIIYTPVVGAACQQFSHIYRRRRGLFVSYQHRNQIGMMLDNIDERDVEVIVVTDGERILGLGDQGAGGMGIPIGKLSLYTLCGGIDPAKTLPIFLDAGTDNKERLDDPLYIGWRHERIRGAEYDQFIDQFVQAVKKKLPKTVLQFEDFANQDARRLLDKYKDQLCTFNDDIQGTAAVAVAGVLAAVKASGTKLRDQQIVMFGAGSAGLGIADLLSQAMVEEGASAKEADDHIWLIDRPGLLHDGLPNLQPAQKRYAKSWEKLKKDHGLKESGIPLLEAIKIAKATALIGTSAQASAFNQSVVKGIAANCERPIIFPLSNPTIKAEAKPVDVLSWTDGKALIGTGSPFDPVKVAGKTIHIGQCNNSYIFPGAGLGIVASRATRVTERMFMASARSLADQSPIITDSSASLFPPLKNIRQVSEKIALAVGLAAQADGVAPKTSKEELTDRIRETMWIPEYSKIKA